MYATQEKVAAGFKLAGEQISSIDMRSQESEAAIGIVQKQLKQLCSHIGTVANAAGDRGGRFGIWATSDQARDFGRCVLAALGRQKDMGEITNTGGGILVPEILQSRFVDLLPKYGKFRANTTVLPMESASALVPKIETDMTVFCPGEGTTINNTDVSFSQLRMTPKTWAALARVSNELDEDSVISIGVILGISIARSMAKMEDSVGFLGDGTAAYFGHKGIVGAFHSISDTISEIAGLKVATGNLWSEFVLGDFRDTVALLPADFDDGAKWYVSKRFYHTVMWALAEAAGVAGIYEILSDKKARHFLGYPVEFVTSMPTTQANSQIAAIFGDLSLGSYLAQRKELTLERSTDVFFANNQIAVRGVERVDVNVFGCGSSSSPGPIVGLITAAS